MWQQFRQMMLNTQTAGEEIIGFFFCKHHQISETRLRYFPKTWVVPTNSCYEHQSTTGLVLKQEFHLYLLKTYLEDGYDLVHIHTHPGFDTPCFSTVDDRHESEYAQFLTTNFEKQPRLISGIFNESLQKPNFRIWNQLGSSFEEVDFYSSWFERRQKRCDPASATDARECAPREAEGRRQKAFVTPTSQLAQDRDLTLPKSQTILDEKAMKLEQTGSSDVMFARQEIFGNALQEKLNELTVTLIGCGGIGSVFAEVFGRLGVKNWVLIDHDCLETTNLNRMPGATWEMAEQQLPKVEYVKQLIQQIYRMNANVKTIPTTIENELATQEIGASDLIVVATDNHYSRQVAQELALKYMRPLVCLGTHIEIRRQKAGGRGQKDEELSVSTLQRENLVDIPRMYSRITIPPLGGGWCLMCGNIINSQMAALESAPREIEQVAQYAGYMEGIDAPAVFWLNSICASTAVGIIQGMVSGFLDIDAGLDWIYKFPESKWYKTDTDYLVNTDCYFCGAEVQAD
ncbi:MAG: ThiF family adenylyltransferase [Okeania sp. SIO2B3]|nr:ThiF family adenylyltransferase [Okeania sp. SIO2B3]